jgi:hypothetical protein
MDEVETERPSATSVPLDMIVRQADAGVNGDHQVLP